MLTDIRNEATARKRNFLPFIFLYKLFYLAMVTTYAIYIIIQQWRKNNTRAVDKYDKKLIKDFMKCFSD
jgi:hypothetical protein